MIHNTKKYTGHKENTRKDIKGRQKEDTESNKLKTTRKKGVQIRRKPG